MQKNPEARKKGGNEGFIRKWAGVPYHYGLDRRYLDAILSKYRVIVFHSLCAGVPRVYGLLKEEYDGILG